MESIRPSIRRWGSNRWIKPARRNKRASRVAATLHHGIERNSTFDIASRIICDVEIRLNLADKLLFISFFSSNGGKQMME
jgi:hypothetical protein